MQEKAAKNAEESISKVNKWASDNDLSTEETSALKDKIYELADNFLMGIFGEDIAEFVYKGLNHDKNVQQAADTGYVQGKNERIDIKKKDIQQSPIPNMRSQSDAIPIPKFNNVKQKDDLYRTVKSIPGTARRK